MAKNASNSPFEERPITRIPLANLLLDPDNPRFGLRGYSKLQEDILDRIVNKFGVNDVLSSLAVNGYFEAEPLVCRKIRDSSNVVVVEGNRRLAACLIITGDERAKDHLDRFRDFAALWRENESPSIDPVPVILFDENEKVDIILSYLGVRHIAAAQPWDSYAKAVWVANVVEQRGWQIQNVARMIGDQHRTINRLLEGYYLIQQLVTTGHFHPEDSVRRGRGSVTEYPFSWVYTILGYVAVRNFLQFSNGRAKKDPLSEDNLPRGALLLQAMFGDKSCGRNSAVGDSRQLGALAAALASQKKIRLLEQGKTISEIDTLTQPIERRLSDGLGFVRETLRDLIARVSEEDIDSSSAGDLLPTASGNRKLSVELHKRLRDIAFGRYDDD
ncbi:MAG: hypothetical protein OYK82_14610 [Gammaproteobacteria bacterium]|nr:hypothetical protein [Gammaproteobacteria bacterium]